MRHLQDGEILVAVQAGGPNAASAAASGFVGRSRPAVSQGLRWAKKGASALTEQALFSGGNFLLNILLARWLSPAEYGAYSLAYAVFLFFASVHAAILVEPMMVFGAGKYARRFPAYFGKLLYGHLALVAPVSLLLLGVALGLGRFYSMDAQRAFLGLLLGAGAILLFWLVRRISYVLLRPGWGVMGGAAYFALIVGSICVLKSAQRLSALTAFLGMAVASLLASILMLARFIGPGREDRQGPGFGEVLAEHWRYGRWAMSTAAIGWIPGHVYYALLPAWLGLEGAGVLRALMNFALPVLQAISALSMLLLPMLVRDRESGGSSRMTRTMLIFLALFVLGGALYASLLWLSREQLFQMFYGGKYQQYSGVPLLLAALLPAGTAMTSVLGNGLRALERPDRIFWCNVGSLASALAVGIPLAAAYGVTGALLGLHVSSAVTILLMGRFYVRSAAATPEGCFGQEARESA